MSDDSYGEHCLDARRQVQIARSFVEIADSIDGDLDVIEVLGLLTCQCVDLFGAGAASVLLADSDGHLRVVGDPIKQIQLPEVIQVQSDDSPCQDCFRTGNVVHHSEYTRSRWPRFASECNSAGFVSVCVIPMRLKSRILGCLNIFMTASGGLSTADVSIAQSLADVASIAIIHDQAMRDAAMREAQLERALMTRIVIEQAKGMIAEHGATTVDEAFTRLREYARSNNVGLTATARALIAGTLSVEALGPTSPVPPVPPVPPTQR